MANIQITSAQQRAARTVAQRLREFNEPIPRRLQQIIDAQPVVRPRPQISRTIPSMTNIEVPKAKLLDTMRTNRDNHRAIFLKAQEKYREVVIQALDERLQQAKTGKPIVLLFHFPEPIDYTESYDDAIARFDWHEGETVELTEEEFKQFVLDKWGWQRLFAANTQVYT